MSHDDAVRKQLVELLRKSHAHAEFDQVVKSISADKMGVRPPGVAYSLWELLEHLRLAQRDILEFSQSSHYQARNWPDEYWPQSPAPALPDQWEQSVKLILADREAFVELLQDPKRDLFDTFPWGDGQTLIREALLIADHNAYHLGEMVVVRRLLGIWP